MWPQISGILDFGDFEFWIWGILDLGISDFGFWILGILDFGDFGFWGFWILDFGPLCSKSLCAAPNAPNLGDFGDFGVWGFWILDFVTNFGFYIRRRRLCTPNRVGGFVLRIDLQRMRAVHGVFCWNLMPSYASGFCLHHRVPRQKFVKWVQIPMVLHWNCMKLRVSVQKHIFHCSCLKPKGPNVFLHQPSSTSTHRVPSSTALNLLMQQKIQLPFVRRVGLQNKKVAAQNKHLQGF